MKKTRKINRKYLSIPITLDEVLISLANAGEAPPSSHLAELSDLPAESLPAFSAVWKELDASRRYDVISRLKDLAEENIEFNFDSIFKHGLDDEDPAVRKACISGLWENLQGWLQRRLIILAQEDPSDEVRIASIQALERFCLDAELNEREESKRLLVNLLLSFFNNCQEPGELRRRSLESVAALDCYEVHQAIENAFSSSNHELKVSAIYAMGANCNPAWLPFLIPLLEDDDAELRYEAARACGEIGEEDAINGLVALLNDEDRDVQLMSVQALGKIGGRQSKEALLEFMESPDELLRNATRQALYEVELYSNPFSPDIMQIDQEEE